MSSVDRRVLEAARIVLERRRIHDSLLHWCRACGYEPARHHRLIIEALEAVERGEIRKLMISMPPGSAKSTYASVLFPPWYLARNPLNSVLAASHSEDLAERWGRRCRNLIEERGVDLGIDVDPKNRAVWRWQLAPTREHPNPLTMGEYLAAGSGSAIAGFRGDLALIDDPIKRREDAVSELLRQKAWDWYTFDYRTRLKPDARHVMIGTRWFEDDLFGRLIEEEGAEWTQLVLPMVSEGEGDVLGRPAGERLWPEWFTDAMVETAMRDPTLWLSLYQQRPTSETGTYWKKHWLHPVEPGHVPPREHLRVYGGSDYATKAASGDYTVHLTVGLDPEDRPWLLEMWREQTTSDVWIREWCEMVKWWRPLTWAEEYGQILSGLGPWIEREQIARKAHTERIQFPSRLDKGMRAQSMRAMIATRGLWYAADLPGRHELEAELLAFPSGRHDDIHDALGLVGQLLDMAVQGRVPKKEAPKPKPEYKPVRVDKPSMTSMGVI